MSEHRISDDGQTIICEAEPTARCRTAPDCDSETWLNGETVRQCTDHDPAHPLTPGHACWIAEGHINPAGLMDTHDDWAEALDDIRPGAAVDIEFHGPDEGATWTYAEGDES